MAISTNLQFMPAFELNRSVTLWARAYGFDFALSMIKPHVYARLNLRRMVKERGPSAVSSV